MPFKSEEQRRYLWANEPEIARDWTDTYGSKIHAADGGIIRLGFYNGGPGPGGQGARGQATQNPGRAPSGPGPDTREKEDIFEQSWSGQPGILGLGGGYRDLKTPGVTPGHGGAYKSRFNPMGIIGGLGGLLMGIPGLGLGINALKNFPKHQNLADWWGSRSNWSTNQTPNNNSGIGVIDPALLDNYSDMKIRDTSFEQNLPVVDEVDEEALEAYNYYRETTPDAPISFEEFLVRTGRQ
jgi:hypothetical protein